MIHHLSLILLLQLVGEVASRGLGLPVPGPVIGMVLFVVLMAVRPSIFEHVRGTAMGLLAHLSLLFVPAGVGVVGHLQSLGGSLLPLLVTIILSTVLTLIVSVGAFLIVSRFSGQMDDQPDDA